VKRQSNSDPATPPQIEELTIISQITNKMKLLTKSLLLTSLLAVFLTRQASAAVLDFTGVTLGNSYSQNGMQVQTSAGTQLQTHWGDVGHLDTFGSGGWASHSLISGGDFTLHSVLMPSVGIFPGQETGRFTAYNNGVALGFVDLAAGSGTFNFGLLFANIDEFQVSSPDTHISWDNVNFTPSSASVPDGGSSIALLGLAMTAVAGLRRKFGV
jgi:VPDSG-CTERM motif